MAKFITLTPEAQKAIHNYERFPFELPEDSVYHEDGSVTVPIRASTFDRLDSFRLPSESYSDAIVRLAAELEDKVHEIPTVLLC